MGTDIGNAVAAADTDAQYDEKAKRLLSNKIILAHILVKTVDEFQGMHPKDVVPYIESETYIGSVPVEPGLTNAAKGEEGQRIVGLNTENSEIQEGLIRFDIIFYVHMKDGISRMIINVEAQKDEPSGYHLLNRAVFYASRLISSQKERDFVKMKYNDIRRVFSIWVCMNIEENCMDYIHLTDDKLLGSYPWKGGTGLLNIVLIGIAEELPGQDERFELHRLLGTLLSAEMSAAQKLEIMETEYGIVADNRIREDVSAMCNLSQGIREKGIAEGEAIGKARGEAIGEARGKARLILNMYDKGYALEQIADIAEQSIEEIKTIIETRNTAPA